MDILTAYKDKVTAKRKLTFNKAFAYWQSYLLERCINIYKWEGLPDSVPAKEIEFRLIAKGFCGIVRNRAMQWIAVFGSLSGVTDYSDEYTTFTYATPKSSGVCTIGKKCTIISNNACRMALLPLIDRYATLLAHADLSLQAILVNSRASGIMTAQDQAVAANINAWYDSLYNGKLMAVVDERALGGVVASEGIRPVPTVYPSSTSIADYFTIQQNLLKSFYNDIGLHMGTEKRERLITAEVNNDDERLLYNVQDGLEWREKAAEELSELFGSAVSVKLNPAYKTDEETEQSTVTTKEGESQNE